jgi:hypothetical protein
MNYPTVSIFSLIYKSTKYADYVYEQVHKYTPLVNSGVANFFFVANDASVEVIEHLKNKNYPYFIQNNNKYTEEELFSKGYAKPEYIHRVYRGWNRCLNECTGEYVCLINSDMGFSENWLENLLKYASENTAVSSLLIERGHERLGHFPSSLNGTGSILYNCGKDPSLYDEKKFIDYVNKNKIVNSCKITEGGVYMPIVINKKIALSVGGYPEGNIAGKNFNDVIDYGDRVFMRKLKQNGVKHITSWDSFSYHFQQGEMES